MQIHLNKTLWWLKEYVLSCHLRWMNRRRFCLQNGGSQEHIPSTIMFCFNEFAFTVQVIHKINSTQILGFILICLYFTTGYLHTCTLQRLQPISLLILGSVFSDCVVFYGDPLKQYILREV